MAGISRTIPDFNGGINEQPDERKLTGQVRDCINAISDPVRGLYKRPGSKRLGTAPLTNVQNGGSWFHYHRDETEGSYIGQVAADGRVRIWSTKQRTIGGVTTPAGHECNVWYVTDNTAYNSGTAAHTSITSYLTPDPSTDTEDIQALTINDTTFLNNRAKITATTGTTPSAAHAYYAYIDLLRSENGRQYGLNVWDPSQTGTTDIKTVTRIKLISDNLAEGNGTGTCPGIGTQVFAATSADSYSSPIVNITNSSDSAYNAASNKKNLIFRITAVGQQGFSGGGDDANPDNMDYACSYSRQITLLHGGSGWVEGDKVTVSLTQAKTTYNYTIQVEKIETSSVKATINSGANGLIRPEPTPFDADTAVTVDTILGGINAGFTGTGLTTTIIGNGIYVSSSSAFNVEIVNNDLMRIMQSEVNNVSDLPNQCKHGYIVKVANAQMSDEDDYYLKFIGENNVDGPGSWVECAKPGIALGFDPATMPHVLQRQADGDFLVKQYTWSDREVGDDNTNLIPSFVGQGINKVLFFRNRLGFLSGEAVILSRAGQLGNFWSDTALTVSAVDPIDIATSSDYPSELFDGIEINTGLLVFSTNQQFLLASDDTVFNPDTVKIRIVGAYNYNKVIPPISLGVTQGFVDNSGKYSRFMEMADIAREGEPPVVESSIWVPTLLPKDIDSLAVSRENGYVIFGKSNTDTVFIYKWVNTGDRNNPRAQSAWLKWKFNNPLKYHFIVNDQLFFLDTDNFLHSLNFKQTDIDPSIDQDNINYLLHLDNYTTVSGGTFDAATNLTTFANQTDWIDDVTTPNGDLVIVDSDSNTAREGRYAKCTVVNTDDFTVPGDWSSATLNIGYLYDYQVDLPKIYPTKQVGQKLVSDTTSSLVIHRLHFSFGRVGLYETTLTRVGKPAYNEVYESTTMDEYLVSDAPYLEEAIKAIPVYEKNTNVDITLKSTHPAPATLRSMAWEGDFSPKFYRRG